MMIQADRHANLASVRWYGTDGSAQNEELVKNEDAAKFAIKTSFINPIFAVEETERFISVSEQVTEEIGHTHRSYAEIAYDALHIAVESSMAVEGEFDMVNLHQSLVSNANSYDGITGAMALNDAGDRESGSYDFWSVEDNDHGTRYEWNRSPSQH
jgi:branched-chain amino acid transport system substrate-binding protein